MNNRIKKQRHFSNSSWVRTNLIKYMVANSGKVTAKDIIKTVGRDGLITTELVMLELCALEDDGSVRLHEQKYEYIGKRRQ